DANVARTDVDVISDDAIDPRRSIDRDHGTVDRLALIDDDITTDADVPGVARSYMCLRTGRCQENCADEEGDNDANAEPERPKCLFHTRRIARWTNVRNAH